jgi:hypothetical protein
MVMFVALTAWTLGWTASFACVDDEWPRYDNSPLMGIDKSSALADIEDVLAFQPGFSGSGAVAERAALMNACVERWAPAGSSYRSMAEKVELFLPRVGPGSPHADSAMAAVLKALKRDLDKDMLRTFEEQVHVAVFDDLLHEARHLLDGNHRLAAAVVAGAAHEDHLRKLAQKHGVLVEKNGTPRNMPSINDDLKHARAYSQTEWRQRQVWFDIRNEAAHGLPEFQQRTPQEVRSMIDDVRDFISRHPA